MNSKEDNNKKAEDNHKNQIHNQGAIILSNNKIKTN